MKIKRTLHRRKYWLVVSSDKHYWEAFTGVGHDAVRNNGLYKFKRYILKLTTLSNDGILASSDPYTRTCWLETALLHPDLKRGKL